MTYFFMHTVYFCFSSYLLSLCLSFYILTLPMRQCVWENSRAWVAHFLLPYRTVVVVFHVTRWSLLRSKICLSKFKYNNPSCVSLLYSCNSDVQVLGRTQMQECSILQQNWMKKLTFFPSLGKCRKVWASFGQKLDWSKFITNILKPC